MILGMGRVALSTGLAGMSGVVGDLLFEQRAGGTVAKARPTAPPRRTEGSKAGERRLVWLSAAWNALDEERFRAWRRFAEASAVRNPATAAWVVPNPYNLFCKYAGRVRQVDPLASLEGFVPPEGPFGGDGVTVRVEGGGARADGAASALRDALDPTPPPPQGEGIPTITFSVGSANAEGVVTEIMTQPLVNARRRVYADRYVSRGFVAFAGAESVEVPCEPGAHACGFRFVRAATGQATAIFELGVVEVGR